MKPKQRSSIKALQNWTEVNQIYLHRMSRSLTSHAKELPSELIGLQSAVIVCQQAIAQLQSEVSELYESDAMSALRRLTVPLSENEISRLLDLNRRLLSITRHLETVVEDVTPRLDAKVADSNDPMYDYEIEACIDYQLREDDPDYAEDDDNYIATRSEPIKKQWGWQREERSSSSRLPSALLAEPHCWIFEDLHSVCYGVMSPRLSLRDCLRIGRIFVDVQVWQQYQFGANGELPCDTKRRWRTDNE
jgi:hypothetical protein